MPANVDNIINTCNGSVNSPGSSRDVLVRMLTSRRSLNLPNLTDPGVPPQSYLCDLCAQATLSEESQPTKAPDIHLSTTSTSSATTGPTVTTRPGSSTPSGLRFSHSSSATSTNTAATTTASGPTTVPPKYTIPTTASSNTVPQSRNQLPTEAVVAIAVCTALAVVGAALLLLCVLRRRQKQQDDYPNDMRSRLSRMVQDFTIPPASSPQPLISPTQSYTNDRPPLTPPLRLRDRKLLPSLLRPLSRTESTVFGPPFDTPHRNNSSSSHYSSHSQKKKEGGGQPFPPSPICSPTHDKLEPRQENTYQNAAPPSYINSPASLSPEPSSPPYTRLKSPPPVAFTFPPRPSPDDPQSSGSRPRKGASSSLRKAIASTSTTSSDYDQHPSANSRTNSTDTATTVVAAPQQRQQQQHEQHHPTAISTNPFAPTPPSSPIRPRRPHDEFLEIPDLVSPLTSIMSPASPSPGPPPNKALPPPPPAPGSGRTSSAASEIGIATTTTTAGAGRSPGSVSLRSLQEQEQHHDVRPVGGGGRGRERSSRAASRDSWGSWEDTTGDRSIIGVALSPSGSLSLSAPSRGAGTVFPYPDH